VRNAPPKLPLVLRWFQLRALARRTINTGGMRLRERSGLTLREMKDGVWSARAAQLSLVEKQRHFVSIGVLQIQSR
jgi:hypothetical protein